MLNDEQRQNALRMAQAFTAAESSALTQACFLVEQMGGPLTNAWLVNETLRELTSGGRVSFPYRDGAIDLSSVFEQHDMYLGVDEHGSFGLICNTFDIHSTGSDPRPAPGHEDCMCRLVVLLAASGTPAANDLNGQVRDTNQMPPDELGLELASLSVAVAA